MRKIILVVALFVMSVSLTFAQKQEDFGASSNTQQIDLLTGTTSVALSSDFLGALTALEIAPDNVFPARLNGATASFPITDGTLERQTLRGEILHSGGLTLTKDGTEVKLKSFIIDTTGEGIILTGLVSANGTVVGRIPLFDLQLPTNFFNFPLRFKRLTLRNVLVTLRPEAAGALNAVFETDAFVPGFNIGTATVRGFGFRD